MRPRPTRGRPRGKRFAKRVTVGLPSDAIDLLDSRAHEEDVTQSEAIRRCLREHFESQEELQHGVLRVKVAMQDLQDLRKAIRNGLVSDEAFALTESVRRYLEWLRTEIKARRETLGSV